LVGLTGSSRPSRRKVALADVDLILSPGETLGIMGVNGAGKTTLLSILAGVLGPTRGTVRRRGRVASMLGLGPSFQQELSGRDNADILLRIAGLSGRDIRAQMSEVEAFADIGHYFNVPVRTYSSGMRARVAFAAAIHARAEIFLIDETLAVGDIEFRQKCYAAIRALQDKGHAFVLVSHSPPLIARMCTRAIVLHGGRKIFDGPPHLAVEAYDDVREAGTSSASAKLLFPSKMSDPLVVREASYREESAPNGTIVGRISLKLEARSSIVKPAIGLVLRSKSGIALSTLPVHPISGAGPIVPGERQLVDITFRRILLTGTYVVDVTVGDTEAPDGPALSTFPHVLRLDVVSSTKAYGFADLDMSLDPYAADDAAES
jgi:ABC-type polysaccharide/polyol phosphate transport system ATPase subunit